MSLIHVLVSFSVSNPSGNFIETDAKKEALKEILCEFIRANMGEGEDLSPPNEKDPYRILIVLDLSDDSFSVVSDTGNKSLTAGIIMSLVPTLDKMDIRPYSG